ncbi:hypothetical protein VMCG_09031 [Cytospora schulzeri]|uniref:F-box domain-containing protein n=1 Tax=Cytospora schulzeri TaxID=448051 RepID=A0A423VP17_9PEZI|nr:hypothetical protein VMCG_09031 [Valsa malicola]
MPVPAATGPGDQGAFLVQARKLYVASKYKAALVHFKMASIISALVKCSCNRDMVITAKKLGISLKEVSIPTCHCKDLNALSLAPNPDRLAMYNLAIKHCTCGSGLVSCDLPAHLGAIEGIAAAYDKLQAHNKALKYASLYIIMAPHAPEGYLRMAKALRLMDTSQSSNTTARCTWIYHQALESVKTYGNKDHGKLKILYSLLRKDIIVSLPTELQTMVLRHLSQAELCRCMRVTKHWDHASRNPSLWKDLKFVKHWSAPKPRPLRPGVLNDIIINRASKLAKSLVIHGMEDFGIDDTKLRPMAPPVFDFFRLVTAMPALKDVSIVGCDACYDKLTDESTSTTSSWDNLERFVLRRCHWVPMRSISTNCTPLLHCGLRLLDTPATPTSFLVRYKAFANEYENITGERLPLQFEQMEHLGLSEYDFYHDNARHRTIIEALSWFLGLLAPSVSNGTLTSLDIPFDNDVQAEFDRVLLDKRSICSLNCNALPPPPSFQPSGLVSPTADAFLIWLEGFPNLTTIGLFPRDREVCAMMVAKILSKESSIRTIYTNELVGVYWDDALKKAQGIGVRIIRADRVPEPVLKPLDTKSNA